MDTLQEIDRKNEKAGKLLLQAAEKEKWKECVRLIEEGSPINVPNKYGNTILHWSVIKKNTVMCRFLLKKKADKKITNKWDMTPYLIAKYNGYRDIQEMLS